MAIDVTGLLSLPADLRLELADMLRKSVGYPSDIETLELPAWQQDRMARLLENADDARREYEGVAVEAGVGADSR